MKNITENKSQLLPQQFKIQKIPNTNKKPTKRADEM